MRSEFAQIRAGEQVMSKWLASLAALLLAMSGSHATVAGQPAAQRPVHTYSIVARDPDSGQLGVAVQSHWFAVGTLVPWAEAGVGAVATQSFVELRYGYAGLDLMRSGLDAQHTMDALLAADEQPDVRQVAMLDAKGGIAVHTGAHCIQYAGHLVGDNFAVQANLMMNEGVPEAMAAAFRSARGTLAERMLAALDAAQAAGGDLRGRQSAAILVVSGESTGQPLQDRLVDLQVEDHPEPLVELRRLLQLQTAYEYMNRGDHALERNDIDAALEEYGRAQALLPASLEMKFWYAVSLLNAGRTAAAMPVLEKIIAAEPAWRELLRRLVAAQLLEVDEPVLARIEKLGLRTEETE
jgi:uncharacterized Ntn-hydrolase superfamily protein